MSSSSPGRRLIALLGDPVEHSLSPRFQNAAIDALGLDAEYRAIRCVPDEVPVLMKSITGAGGAGNVTVPHKGIAAGVVDRPTKAVTRTGACNTFWIEKGLIHGDNTDVVGFSAALRALIGAGPAGMRVLLIGAGGAARGVACALVDDRAAEVVVINRSPERGRDLVARFNSGPTRLVATSSVDSLDGEEFDLVVNATSLGIREGDPLPLPLQTGVRFRAAFDLVYRPDETEWVRRTRAAGIPAADGLEMLLHQGAAAFTRWWNLPAPIEAMREALPRR